MKYWLKSTALALVVAATAFAAPAQEKKTDAPATAAPKPAVQRKPTESAVEPKPKTEEWWTKKHATYLQEVKENAGKVDLLFVGDSITDGWHNQKKLWADNWEPLKAQNIGIGGDRTQHVIWRLQNGEVAGIKPKLAVLMIGTNNLGVNTNEEIVAGITGCVSEIKRQLPETKLLLLAVFPRGEKADDRNRGRIKAINEEIAKLDDGGKTVKYLDIGAKFLEDDGTLPKSVMPDALHPNAKGYQIWIDATMPTVTEMMK